MKRACRLRARSSCDSHSCVLALFASNDLRLHDHYALSLAVRRAQELRLPVVCAFCFDIRTFSQPSLIGGFFRCGILRARFLIESVDALRKQYAAACLGLRRVSSFSAIIPGARCAPFYVRVGAPEIEIPKLACQLHASAVYCTTQYAPHEGDVQHKMRKACHREGVDFVSTWGTTLIHIDDLETSPKRMTEKFRWFFDDVEVAKIRPTAPYNCDDGRLRGVEDCKFEHLPSPDVVPLGELPTLDALGYGTSLTRGAFVNADSPVRAFNGGEESGLRRLDEWLEHEGTQGYVPLGRDWRHRSDMRGIKTSKLAPWIAHGCVSPRRFLEAVRKHSYRRLGTWTTEAQYREAFFRIARRDFWHFFRGEMGSRVVLPLRPHS